MQKGCLPQSGPPYPDAGTVRRSCARGTVSMGPVCHMCITIYPAFIGGEETLMKEEQFFSKIITKFFSRSIIIKFLNLKLASVLFKISLGFILNPTKFHSKLASVLFN